MALVPVECSKCGAPLKIDDCKQSTVCEYCGCKFVTHDLLEHKKASSVASAVGETVATVAKTAVDEVKSAFSTGNVNKTAPTPRPAINGCALAALIVCFWPGAIIYAIVKVSAQKEWDAKYKK